MVWCIMCLLNMFGVELLMLLRLLFLFAAFEQDLEWGGKAAIRHYSVTRLPD